MAMKAAVSKVQVSPAVGEALRLVGGNKRETSLGLLRSLAMRFHVNFLERAGFQPGYFEAEFLEGCRQALKATGSVVSSRIDKQQMMLGGGDFLQSRLMEVFAANQEKLAEEQKKLDWRIKAVSEARLSSLGIIFGLRRRHLGLQAPSSMFYHEALGVSVIVREDAPRQLSRADLVEALRQGGTVFAEVAVTCTQEATVTADGLDEPDIRREEDVCHHLTLEADLAPDFHVDEDVSRVPQFDSDRGWLLVDINSTLAGNSLLQDVKRANSSWL
mmetsp:Transcript_68950/g.165469  ORF Transcript_68950/g.165469 Transcript_68950/m.165469 type:complete len:273 (+) Transcript_68950:72-890(+)